ncbi:MAG: alkaline phosphatase [Pseudonocardia sp.]|nr:alkaline phosphatase [Pseudonocardia sp.]
MAGVVSAVLVGGFMVPSAQAAEIDERAKNIILLIGDGMGVTHVNAARQRYVGVGNELNMEQLAGLGSVSTYSVERNNPSQPVPVPDSAPTATAWSSGVKTYNNAIGVDAFGNVVATIMEQAKAAGLATGNVSTSEMTDATPAAQYSHAQLRACQGPTQTSCSEGEANIATQIARNGTADVILGGGLSRFEPDDQVALEEQGYTVLNDFGDETLPLDQALQTADTQRVATEADLAAVPADAGKVFGLFNRGNLTVEKYKAENPTAPEAAEPTLPEMTAKAIELLTANEDDEGFFLQVEGALIDKRSHANDAAQALQETITFDQAVQVARDFAATPEGEDTLIIVTADHECAGFNIIDNTTFTNAEATAPPGNVDSSNAANNSVPSRQSSANVLDPARSTGPVNGVGSDNPTNFAPAFLRSFDDPADVVDGDPAASLALTYLSGNHTGANVPLFTEGPGSEQLVGLIDQTEIYGAMTDALEGLG